MRKSVLSAVFCAVLWGAGAPLHGQVPSPPAFEVASVKPAAPGNRTRVAYLPGGRFTATSMALTTLLSLAYDMREFQMVGGPAWMASARWDVSAKTDNSSATSKEMSTMLRALLAERFKLVLHPETRTLPVYELSVAASGLKIKESAKDKERSLNGGSGRAVGAQVSMETLSQFLSMQLSRAVRDRTGVSGAFDIALTWAPDVSQDLSAPSIFTAVQEQLGLKLVSARGPVESIVIDSVERPTSN